MRILERLVRLPRCYKRNLLRLSDTLLVGLALVIAQLLAGREDTLANPLTWGLLGIVMLSAPLVFGVLGGYRIVLRFLTLKVMSSLMLGVLLLTGLFHVLDVALGWPVAWQAEPVFAMLAILAVVGSRLSLHELYRWSRRPQRRPVIIYGAGAAGCELAHSLHQGERYRPLAFVDDWRGMHGSLVEGLPVHSPAALPSLIRRHGIAQILLAIPSAPRCRRRQILEMLARFSVPVQTIPGSDDLVSGRARIADTCDVQVEDLLGREPVPPFPALMTTDIRDKVVMVTGAGGSIGSELCRQVIAQGPRALVLVDNAEYALYAIDQELQAWVADRGESVKVHALLASVQEGERMREILDCFAVQSVYHAAAYKHVPLVECNLVEGLRNNVFGTLGLARAAVAAGVESFVMVSTDKAVRPTNVMGASKRLTELICQALAVREEGHGRPRFCMVRFGNVLGSSGSVVPRFRRQIEQGGPLEVTHPDITRYFMTIPEAAQLVIQAGAMGGNGEVFVLDMGEPVRIAELAANMVRLAGLEVKDAEHPEGDIEIVFTGLRPGEKLYEELLIGDDVAATAHPRIMTCREASWGWDELEAFLGELDGVMRRPDPGGIQRLLASASLGYAPEGPLVDHVWQARQDARSKEAQLRTEGVGKLLLQERFRSSGEA
ncbi:polysaccharide biosynthesis protein [Halomonas organivorans]